jgi:hypothetical protein
MNGLADFVMLAGFLGAQGNQLKAEAARLREGGLLFYPAAAVLDTWGDSILMTTAMSVEAVNFGLKQTSNF